MRFEQEVVAQEVLPALRSMIATELSESYGLNQREIAIHMDLTQPAVSQYLSGKRADQEVKSELEEDPQIQVLIGEAAGKAARREDYSGELSSILETVRSKGLLRERFKNAERL